jgi:hypothetical protein
MQMEMHSANVHFIRLFCLHLIKKRLIGKENKNLPISAAIFSKFGLVIVPEKTPYF